MLDNHVCCGNTLFSHQSNPIRSLHTTAPPCPDILPFVNMCASGLPDVYLEQEVRR